jgi:hypothetical protein
MGAFTMSYTTEERLEILRKRLQEAENEISRIRQLRPLVSIGGGLSERISFEQMSEFATLWMEQEGIHTKEDLEAWLK